MNHASYSILSCGSYIPVGRRTAEELQQLYPQESERLKGYGYRSVSVEAALPSPAMAEQAAQTAIERAGLSGDSLAAVAYVSIHRQADTDLWCPASHLQMQFLAPSALPLSIRQGCDGALIATQLCLGYLEAVGPEKRAIVVASDRFSGTSFDPVISDYGIVYGDGAAAIIIGKGQGVARILGINTVSDPALSSLHLVPDAERSAASIYDVRHSKRAYFSKYGLEDLVHRTRSALRDLKDRMFSGPVLERDVKYILFPHLGMELLQANYFPVFEGGAEKAYSSFGVEVGHLGAGDQFAALDRLLASRAVVAGDYVLLIGAGAGFSWTGLLLRIGP